MRARHHRYRRLHQVSTLLRRRRHDVQPREETTSETSAAEPGQVAGPDAVSSAEEAGAGKTTERHEHDGTVRGSVGGNAFSPIVDCVTACLGRDSRKSRQKW